MDRDVETGSGWATAGRALPPGLDAAQRQRLETYATELLRWNARFNLVSRADSHRLWPRHILDSLSVLPLLASLGPGGREPRRLLDLGTGAGLPGLPLAIARPRGDWLLIDRNARKIRFLELVIGQLGLANAGARLADSARLEAQTLGPWPDGAAGGQAAEVIVSRAVAAPTELIRLGGHLLEPGGAFLLLAGVGHGSTHKPVSFDGPDAAYELEAVHTVPVPGLDQPHEVIIIRKNGDRRPGLEGGRRA